MKTTWITFYYQLSLIYNASAFIISNKRNKKRDE